MTNKLSETVGTYEKDVDRYVKKLEFPLPKKELDDFINLLKGKDVLDAGCGAGRDSKYFVEKGLNVKGIDLSENMLAAASKRVDSNFSIGDVRRTNFPDQFFDGVWCYNTFLHLDKKDLRTTIAEFKRVLKNEGILFVATKYGEGEVVKQSEKGVKHFFLYKEDYLKNIFEEFGFEVKSVNRYKQGAEDFIDMVLVLH